MLSGLRERPTARRRKRHKKWLHLAQNDECLLCGKWLTRDESTFEHIIPKSVGGTWAFSNLALSHRRCNLMRGDRSLTAVQQGRLERIRAALIELKP